MAINNRVRRAATPLATQLPSLLPGLLKSKASFWAGLALLLATLWGCGDGDGDSASNADNGGGRNGTGGSTARMTLSGDYLYAIANDSVQVFNVSMPSTPNPWAKVQVQWNIETLYPYGNYLLIGASDGMHILDNTDPASPVYIADFQHANARDPVVAQNNTAYVTLRDDNSSTTFNAGVNELNIVDITDIKNPLLSNTVAMQNPSGLAVDGPLLFICDGRAGLKIFDITDRTQPKAKQQYLPEVQCNDVIAQNNTLYIITDTELLQYDYSAMPPTLISRVGESS